MTYRNLRCSKETNYKPFLFGHRSRQNEKPQYRGLEQWSPHTPCSVLKKLNVYSDLLPSVPWLLAKHSCSLFHAGFV